jgi:hypothetical protein
VNRIEKTILTTVTAAALVFSVINFITMKNEHHETLDLIGGLRPVPPAAQPSAQNGAGSARFRTSVPCPTAGPRTMTNLAIGQSNAGAYGGLLTRSEHSAHVVEFFQGRCYIAEDPLIGADASGGSPWVMLANRLIATGMYDNVVIATMARGGTSIGEWRNGGRLNAQLQDLGFALATAGLPATDVMWVQGEAERSPAAQYHHAGRYAEALQEVITTTRHDAPHSAFYVALTSWCPLDAPATGPQQSIRDGQSALVSSSSNIRLGADLDTISKWGDRYDQCHLTADGLRKFVDGWMGILAPYNAKMVTEAIPKP